MAAHHVLNEDWSEYDSKKKTQQDTNYFSCDDSWEVEYLVNKIARLHPGLTHPAIRLAIQASCKLVQTPRPRSRFVSCVISQLSHC